MTVDAPAALSALLYVFAYGAPTWLTWRHVARQVTWSADPAVFASIVATFAVMAMNGRTGTFLEGNLPEPEAGPFPKHLWVALYTAAAAALGLVVFAWILPVLGQRMALLLKYLRPPAEDESKSRAPTRSVLDYAARPSLLNGVDAIRAGVAHVCAIATCSLALAVYLLWPALPLAIEQVRQISAGATLLQGKAADEARRSTIRRLAVGAAVRANELVNTLTARRQSCSSEACTAYSDRRLQQVVATLAGWSLALGPGGSYSPEAFAVTLHDLDAIDAVHERLEDLARKNRVVLPARPRQPVEASLDSAALESEGRATLERNLGAVSEQLSALTDPRRAIALIANDTTMALAIGLELAAIALTLAACFTSRGSR